MADCIACSCVTCPKCGTWVVVTQPNELGSSREKFRANCPAPDCGKEFEFEADETRVFEIPLSLFERRHFYGSDLRYSTPRRPGSRGSHLQAVSRSVVVRSGCVGRCCWSRDRRWGLRPSSSLSCSSIPRASLAVLSA